MGRANEANKMFTYTYTHLFRHGKNHQRITNRHIKIGTITLVSMIAVCEIAKYISDRYFINFTFKDLEGFSTSYFYWKTVP